MITRDFKRTALVVMATAAAVLSFGGQQAAAETVIKVNLDPGLRQLDPIWTTAYISRSHGYMVYDTLSVCFRQLPG